MSINQSINYYVKNENLQEFYFSLKNTDNKYIKKFVRTFAIPLFFMVN